VRATDSLADQALTSRDMVEVVHALMRQPRSDVKYVGPRGQCPCRGHVMVGGN
jgi:hypothetical protein